MKMKLFLTILICCCIQFTFAQKKSDFVSVTKSTAAVADSTLLKMVKGINEVIRARVKAAFPPDVIASYQDYAVIDQEGRIPIDSLLKYNIKDFKNITVSFGEPVSLYSIKSLYGVIMLYRKPTQ
ncbi:hypothetical protein [Pedobacter metabolipauper]|uniref:Uncharacterized protein n=1 Tax=Pedobacter metabolipauper TaxID=425513 RepID=A0A4V3D1H3_9SPHI|nr:hypothetical protein [Pedobacter metabolipauper]TDQ11183.1 hypothetical protein ATK78_0299 [Pedobacter metabolipauper]